MSDTCHLPFSLCIKPLLRISNSRTRFETSSLRSKRARNVPPKMKNSQLHLCKRTEEAWGVAWAHIDGTMRNRTNSRQVGRLRSKVIPTRMSVYWNTENTKLIFKLLKMGISHLLPHCTTAVQNVAITQDWSCRNRAGDLWTILYLHQRMTEHKCCKRNSFFTIQRILKILVTGRGPGAHQQPTQSCIFGSN